MWAIAHDRYGPPTALDYREFERPEVLPDRVLVEVHAAGVNPVDWHMVTGTPFPLRLAGTGVLRPKRVHIGIDVAGVVAEVGAEVTEHQVGDRVYGAASGSYAEYVSADAGRLNPLPDHMSMNEGAGVGVAAITALQGLRDKAKVQAGDHVLINGASGGVGTFAVQIAKLMGAQVTGVCSGRNVDMVRSLGADHVIDYTTTDFTTGQTRYDALLDNVGSHPFRDYRAVLTNDATVVMVGGPKSGTLKMIAGMVRNLAQAARAPQKAAMFIADETAEDLAVLHEWFAAGQLRTEIDRTYPLAQAPEALGYLGTQRAQGKIILTTGAADR